jgi:aldose 1-epimerase
VSEVDLTTVELCDPGSHLAATFAPGAGMVCCSLRHNGQELLAQNAGLEAYGERGKTMGIPLLYPWANRLAGFQYTAAGKTVQVPHDTSLVAVDGNGLPIHGVIGGQMAWRVRSPPAPQPPAGPPPRQAVSSLGGELEWSESAVAGFAAFPFRHEVGYEARLAEGRLEIEVTVRASGADEVPVAFGFHPYLAPPGGEREDWLIELPAMRHLRLDERQIPTGPDRYEEARSFLLAEHELDDGFDRVSPTASFAVTAGERRLSVELREGYEYAQVFAPRDGRYVCFEPMTAAANGLASGEGLRVLAPGESHTARFGLVVQ